MTTVQKALLWAGTMIGAAFYSNHLGLSDGAGFAITMAITGAAFASLYAGRGGCGKGCA